jgi:hypothetical protein
VDISYGLDGRFWIIKGYYEYGISRTKKWIELSYLTIPLSNESNCDGLRNHRITRPAYFQASTNQTAKKMRKDQQLTKTEFESFTEIQNKLDQRFKVQQLQDNLDQLG